MDYIKKNEGYCHCCRNTVTFTSKYSWLRDHYSCSACSSIPRQRHLFHILDKYFPNWEEKNIHESSPSNDQIKKYAKLYTASQFFNNITLGDYHENIRCENLESLTFDNESFDLFITQDVLEHVFNPNIACKEIMRVLKIGGAHVFTTPKDRLLKKSSPRAVLDNGEVIHLKEEDYHGNPIGEGRSLVTWNYGDDFEYLINQWCGFTTLTYITRDDSLGLDGEFLEVFVTLKF